MKRKLSPGLGLELLVYEPSTAKRKNPRFSRTAMGKRKGECGPQTRGIASLFPLPSREERGRDVRKKLRGFVIQYQQRGLDFSRGGRAGTSIGGVRERQGDIPRSIRNYDLRNPVTKF